MSDRQRFAHTIGFDAKRGVVSIDGVDLPYLVAGGDYLPELVDFAEGRLWGVTLTLYADHVELIGQNGERRLIDSEWHEAADMEWARREANRIVHEGMADILHALWNSTATRAQALQVLGLDEADLEALRSETTHSEERQNGDTAP